MAMAPRFFGTIATHINDQHLTGSGFNRIVVEKPFGHDLASAEQLNKEITASFDENDIFRIDHYLGKEMIQNIMPMRFTNPLIKNIWSGEYIKNIQITLAERLGVEARGGYYDTSGALRDMVQTTSSKSLLCLQCQNLRTCHQTAFTKLSKNCLRV